ncbi:MAG: prephenate dehydrogenase [Ruminococcaceae bacterium]|nr:prephenate dehydrogenase [Oscillospiraceae bacterium]
MELSQNTKILIVGLGLMGGSYAIALKKKGYSVGCITRSQSSIDYALANGIIDYGTTEVDPTLLGDADLVVFSLYPRVFLSWIEENQQYLKPGAILTDVTGVKTSIVYRVQAMLRPDVEFVAAHPMAGREVYGVENSAGVKVDEANFIVTPTKANTPEAVALIKRLGEELGYARVSELTPEAHDEIVAFVSQLAHCLAVVLMTCNDLEHLEDYTGNSFRDLTRIAHINEDMWSELFVMNREALLHQMDLFTDQFARLRDALAQNDMETMKTMMRLSTVRRDAFDKK